MVIGYPSDGIVQVEEEEEEFDNETYTIENDVRQRRIARSGKTKQASYPRGRPEPKGSFIVKYISEREN